MKKQSCEIVVLQSSDLHGCLLPVHYATQFPLPRSFSKLCTAIKEQRMQYEHTVLIDNGDTIQGSPLTYYHAKIEPTTRNPVISCLNLLNYDAAVIGNHEFNYGLPYLQQAIKQSHFPWLSANIVSSMEQDPCAQQSYCEKPLLAEPYAGKPFFGQPYIIKQFENGLRLAILGLTTSYIPNWELPEHIEGLSFQSVVHTAKQWIAKLKKEEHIDIMVVSYHGGFERDVLTGEETELHSGENVAYELCEKCPEIDVLLTGHQHQCIENISINGVTIIQPGYEGQALGKVSLYCEYSEGKWKIKSKQSTLIYTDDCESDSEVETLLSAFNHRVEQWLDRPIGYSSGQFKIDSHHQARLTGHPLIALINEIQLNASGAQLSCTSLFDDEASGFGEHITMRDILSTYKYPNTLKVLFLSGRDIKLALEHNARYFSLYKQHEIVVHPHYLKPKPQHFNYDMWTGISYTLNISKPINTRLTDIQYNNKPLQEDDVFQVVMNNYRASGGGEYIMFKNKPIVKEISIDMVEIITNYIRNSRSLEATRPLSFNIIS